MNSENEEQKAVPQTLCGALQKEANCKCLVLSVLIYGCLAAVTWCRCANVTKIVINFSTFPIKSTKHVSPCDDGYIYIPVAFMGMLYLVYLVECYHSPIRIDLLHAESQSSALAKLTQLRLAQPTIWWKAISYHYVRRKRQVMRYRNGDNFTTTQVYYERVNSHAATSFYYYDYCGSKDISKELVLDPKTPITKISLSKGFAFSNVRSATEFEEARSRFFAEQEFRDDYMEMREGLDLGCNFSPITLVAVLGNPWFTRSYVYWCLSALLLSWPLRIIIECNTQYVDYQITKLFGVNYDTPTNIQIHTSASQLSAPGSYMLAPSYSEALLMEPAGPTTTTATTSSETPVPPTDLVPSYSEALLYERAAAEHQPGGGCSGSSNVTTAVVSASSTSGMYDERLPPPQYRRSSSVGLGFCECPCHGLVENNRPPTACSQDSLHGLPTDAAVSSLDGANTAAAGTSKQRRSSNDQDSTSLNYSCTSSVSLRVNARICDSCLGTDTIASGRRSAVSTGDSITDLDVVESSRQSRALLLDQRQRIPRDYSEPDLRRSSEMLTENALGFLRANGRSLENIMENEEIENTFNFRAVSERAEALVLDEQQQQQQQRQVQPSQSTGAIPKRTTVETSNPSCSNSVSSSSNGNSNASSGSRVTVNPIAEAVKRLPNSRSTYFCLKSILKQNRRRFTLVTPEELQSLTRNGSPGIGSRDGQRGDFEICGCDGCRTEIVRPTSLPIDKRQRQLSSQSLNCRRENSRTLIFASPVQEICPLDPFGGRNVVSSEQPPGYVEAATLPVLSRLRRSFAERTDHPSTSTATTVTSNGGVTSSSSASSDIVTNGSSSAKTDRAWKHRRTQSTDPHLASFSNSDGTRTALLRSTETGRSETAISLPSYDGLTMPPDSRNQSSADERSPFLDLDELAATTSMSTSFFDDATPGGSCSNEDRRRSRLTRSLTERRSAPESRRHDRNLRKSFTERIDTGCRIVGVKRTNINIETSL